MPFEQTITIINNSGKIISTGKHLVNIFKDAKAAYQEKKATLKAERRGVRRAQTFDAGNGEPIYEYEEYDEQYEEELYDYHPEPRYIEDRRRSQDDFDRRSYTSARSQRSRLSHRSGRTSRHGGGGGGSAVGDARRPRGALTALTESNLRTLSEVSSTAPSQTPKAYRSPYAETAPRDLMLSRPTLHHAATYQAGEPTIPPTEVSTAVPSPRDSMAVARPRSDPSLRQRSKSVDMDLAYGNIPPDLASRHDLDHYVSDEPEEENEETEKEAEARTLIGRIESLLDEAHCIHHSAASTINKLQENPEAAAAVALTLAELSAVLSKMSPGFLGVLKGGFPAVFALLASPQFLIGTSIAVGVTVIIFGGWKIVKRIREAKAREQEKMAFEMTQQPAIASAPAPSAAPPLPMRPDYARTHHGGGPGSAAGFDEALVLEEELEEELSTIETWRRGIAPFGEDEGVDAELISPEAMRSRLGDDERTLRSVRTHRTDKTHRTRKTSRSRKSRHGGGDDDEHEVPDRKSSKGFGSKEKEKDGHGHGHGHGHREREKEKERDKERDNKDDVSVAGSHRSHRSTRSRRTEVKAIEDGSSSVSRRGEDESLDAVLRPKEKKNNMLKTLFKKMKDKDGREHSVSVVA